MDRPSPAPSTQTACPFAVAAAKGTAALAPMVVQFDDQPQKTTVQFCSAVVAWWILMDRAARG